MTTPKPYGLTKDEDLRWECLQLAACTSGYDDPFHALTTAELFAGYVKGEITVTLKGDAVDAEVASKGPGDAKVIPIGRKPA